MWAMSGDGGDFTGRAVLVTGGTRGIGAGIAAAFLAAGADVLVCGRTPPADETALAAAGGRRAVFSQADVRDPAQAERVVAETADRFGRLDVVVNNAGGAPYAEAATASPRFHSKIIELNLIAPLHVSQAANRIMQGQDGGGSIVMIGSVSGIRPSPGTAAYGAAKAGLASLATSLAVEWAPAVRVNTVVVGPVETPALSYFSALVAGLMLFVPVINRTGAGPYYGSRYRVSGNSSHRSPAADVRYSMRIRR